MATWFAQNSSVNIDSANQWNSAANGTGSALTWANLDPADILVANGKTGIVINVDFTCSLITNVATGGTAGGGFTMNAGRTITCDITTSSATCVSITAAGTCTINGNITGGTSGSAIYGVNFNNGVSGVLNVVGNCTGGAGGTNLWAVGVLGGGILNVTGTVAGGSTGVAPRAIGVQSTNGAVVNITGNVIGYGASSGTFGSGVYLGAASSLFVTGNLSGRSAIDFAGGSPTAVITGDIVCNASSAVIIGSSGALLHNGSVTQTSTGSFGVFNSMVYRIHPSANKTREYRTYNTTTYADNGSRTYYTGGIALGHPATSNVRSGTVYGASNEFTGTLAVPSPTLVAIGVATDNTVGSYSPTGGLDAAGVRAAIGLASANLDTQLAAIPSAASNAAAMRTELTTELGRIDATVSSRSTFAGGAVASVTGNVGGNVVGSVGSILGVTFPTHFNDLEIAANGHVSAAVQSIANNSITASSIQGGAITAAKFATDAITAAALAADAVTEIQSGLATAANQTTIIQYIDTEITAIKTVTDRLNTGLVQDGAVWQFTVNMLENGPAGAGGGSATLGNQELILDQLDLIQNKTDLISGAGAIGPLLAGAVLEPGTITGFPSSLTIGDSYTTANGRAIQLPIVDTDGNPISSTGSLLFADASVTFTISRARETDPNRIITGTATVVDPAGTGTSGAPYALVQLSSSETSKGKLGYKYNAVLKFTWPGTGTDVMSFESSTEVQFDN